MKLLHLADLHARDNDLEELMKCCSKVANTVVEERPDVIVIAGDIFDSRDIRLDTDACKFIFQFIAALAEHAPVAIVAGTPLHEGKATESLIYASKFEHNVIVSLCPEQLYLKDGQLFNAEKSKPDLILSMIPTPTKQYFRTQSDIKTSDDEIAGAMTEIFSGFGAVAAKYSCPHVLVGHFSVRGAAISETQVMIGKDIEIGKDQITLSNPDLVLLGHIHKAQFIEPNFYYSGSIYRLNYGETEEKGFWLHGWEDGKQWSKFILTPTRKMLTVREDFVNDDIKEIDQVLYRHEEDEIKNADIKVEFKAYQDEASQLDKEKIEDFYKSAGANSVDVRIIHVPRENIRSENLLKLTSLRDKVQEMAMLKNEPVSESTLKKADALDTMDQDQVLRNIANL